MTCTGEQGLEFYQTFDLYTDTEKLRLQHVLAKFENYCNPRTNTTIIRHKFFTYKQSEGQSFNNFVTELRKLSNECSSGDLKDSLIKDMIIYGVVDNSLRKRMLREPDINLKKATELSQAAEELKCM